MEFKIEEISPVERKVEVEASVDEVQAALGATIALYRKDAQMDGFRKGKVPSSIIETRHRKQVYAEATQDLVNLHINEIMNDLKVQPVSGINFDGGEIVRGEPFKYSISFEVMPAITLPSYTGYKAKQEKAEVDDAEVEAVFERVRNNLAETSPVETPRKAQDGDIAVVSFQAFENGEPLNDIQAANFELVLGEGQSLEEFEEIVKTLAPTEKTEKEITFPEDFLNPEFAGRTMTMKVELHRLKVKSLPPLDDDLAQKAGGFPSLEKMREAITKSYMDSREQLNKSVAQKSLLDQVMDGVEFELPESMVKDQQERMLKDLEARMDRQGKSLESLGKTQEELLAGYREEAEGLIRIQVFLLAIADKEELEVSEEELDQFFMRQAAQTGENFNQLKRFYMENNLIFMVRDRLRADKAMDLIYDAADIEMVPAGSLAEDASNAEDEKKPGKKAAAKKDEGEKKTATKKTATKKTAEKKTTAKKTTTKKAAVKKDGEEKKPAAKKTAAKKAAPTKAADKKDD